MRHTTANQRLWKTYDTLIGWNFTYGRQIVPREFLIHKQCRGMPRNGENIRDIKIKRSYRKPAKSWGFTVTPPPIPTGLWQNIVVNFSMTKTRSGEELMKLRFPSQCCFLWEARDIYMCRSLNMSYTEQHDNNRTWESKRGDLWT